jgi:uncharacterized protein YkwD
MNRQNLIRRACAAWLGVWLMGGAAQAADPLPPIPIVAGEAAVEQTVIADTNRERVAAGLPPLKPDARLQAAARLHGQDMVQRGYFAHASDKPGHENPSKRIHRAGALDFGAAENIAQISSGHAPQQFVIGWMASPGHRANILNPAYTHIGVGVVRRADGQAFGVQKFVSRSLDLALDVTRAEVELRQLRLEGRTDAGLQLALFAGGRYLGVVATDEQGQFVREFDFVAGQALQLGWRRPGAAGAFLTQASLAQPAGFEPGPVPVRVQAGAPYAVQAQLQARRETMSVLTLRLQDAVEGASLIERAASEERRVEFVAGIATVRCPVAGGRRTLTLLQRSRVESRFALDCETGAIEPGVGG